MTKRILVIVLLFAALASYASMVPAQRQNRVLYAAHIIKLQLSAETMSHFQMPAELYGEADSFGVDVLDELKASLGDGHILRAHIELKDRVMSRNLGLDRWVLVKYEHEIDIPAALEAFKTQSRWIDQAIPEYIAYTSFVPNDPYYPNNWGHNNTGQLPAYSGSGHTGSGVGTPGFDARAQLAWDDVQGMGSSSIIIGIIDSGVDTAHPDLRLVSGYDYGDNDSNPMDNSAEPGHGTCCAGIAAGKGNNSLGISGIAAGCSVMPLKIADSDGYMYFSYIENALIHCANNNVDVASMSLGASMSYGSSPSTDSAILAAYNSGVILFAATGNDNTSTISYPANNPYIISVGAASPTGQRKSDTSSDGEYWWGSNYGVNTPDDNDAVDIMGPTILPATDITGSGGYDPGNYDMFFNGTSCATPYVAGAAALILSKDPSLTPSQLRGIMTSTATDMTYDGGAGWDRYTGYGMINAYAALNTLTPGMPFCEITSPTGGQVYDLGSNIQVNVTATDTDGSITQVAFYLDDATTPSYTDYSAPYSWTWNTTGADAGDHTIRATATDNSSNTASSSVSIYLMGPADEGFESGNFSSFPWQSGGNATWTIDGSTSFSGTYSARSGLITHNQTSSMSLEADVSSAGSISFYSKVSSESGYDYLRFYIDNTQIASWSGQEDWAIRTYPVTSGTHTFRWTYSKDNSVSSGSDAAWVDHIILPPTLFLSPPQIAWDPSSIEVEMQGNSSDSRILSLSNTGDQELSYTISLPSQDGTVLSESFELSSIPAGWTQEYVGSSSTNWIFTTGGYSGHPSTAYDGSLNARLYRNSSTGHSTRLITPALDLSSASSANLSFWHAQADWAGDQDELKVLYRNSASSNWSQLAEYTDDVSTWTQRTIPLTNLSGTYYIAFEGLAQYGYGVCLDLVEVTMTAPQQNQWISIDGETSLSGTIAGGAETQIDIDFDTNGINPGSYESVLTITSNSSTNPVVSIPVSLTVSNQPEIVLSHTELDFGIVRVNQSSSLDFSIQNPGTASLSCNITTPPGFTVAGSTRTQSPLVAQKSSPERNSMSVIIAPGATASYTISFQPTQLISYDNSLQITNNAGPTQYIDLLGTGGSGLLEINQSLFTASLAPGASASQTLILSNTGNMVLSYTLATVPEAAWLGVEYGYQQNNTIAPGTNRQIDLDFDATALNPGTYQAQIDLSTDDPFNPSVQIDLELTVTEPLALLSPLGGEEWFTGSTQSISWNYSGTGPRVTLYYRVNEGIWTPIATPLTSSGFNQYSWQVPALGSSDVQIRIRDSVEPYFGVVSEPFSVFYEDAPGVPQNLSISRDSLSGQISLDWDAAENAPDSYRIYFSPTGAFAGEQSLLAIVSATRSSYTINNPPLVGFYMVTSWRNIREDGLSGSN